MKLNVSLKGLDKALSSIQDYQIQANADVKNIVRDTTLQIVANSKMRSPVLSGTLKRSIESEITPDGMSGKVFTNLDYAPSVEFGSAPHIIQAKDAKVLSDGKQIFGKEVHHPGTPAQPFLFPAYEDETIDFLSNLKKALGGSL
jgi:hypothetical protein